MNMLQVSYLLDIVESKSIHKTADKYNISPQGASKALHKLEQELNLSLIKRSTKGVCLTEEGQYLLESFKKISEAYGEILLYGNQQNGIDNHAEAKGSVTIAIIPRIADSHLSNLISKFNSLYPKIKIMVKTMEGYKILQEASSYNCTFDLSLISFTSEKDNHNLVQYLHEHHLNFIEYAKEALYVCGKKCDLDKLGENVEYNKPISFPIIAYKYSGLDDEIIDHHDFEVNSLSAQLDLINNNQGLGVFTKYEFNRVMNNKKYAYKPFEPMLVLTSGYLYNESLNITLAIRLFMDFLGEYFKKISDKNL